MGLPIKKHTKLLGRISELRLRQASLAAYIEMNPATSELKVPKEGEVLIHRFRKADGEVRATVVSISQNPLNVRVEIDGKEYASLSAAARAAGGTSQNGWIYWGLKKQNANPKRRQ